MLLPVYMWRKMSVAAVLTYLMALNMLAVKTCLKLIQPQEPSKVVMTSNSPNKLDWSKSVAIQPPSQKVNDQDLR